MGCGSLLYLVLECADIYENDNSNDVIYKAAKHIAKDIVKAARMHLNEARSLRDEIISGPHGAKALSTFLHSLASETFFDRLEDHDFNLTDRRLRNVGMEEHFKCGTRKRLNE